MLSKLLEAVRGYTARQRDDSPYQTAIDGVTVLRSSQVAMPSHLIHKPAICAVVQGAKHTAFGGNGFDCGTGQALVVSVEMPASEQVVAASLDRPFLGIVLELDPVVVEAVLDELDEVAEKADDVEMGRGALVAELDAPIADCLVRTMRLLETPKAIPMLYPAIMREICYWLLTGPHGAEIARLTLAKGHGRRIIDAVDLLRQRFAETVRGEELAEIAQLSPSAFHRRFKTLTGMTPLQYQKHLRLLEARRLMIAGSANVETAAFTVGYESPSQFSREYTRMFGTPPKRDVSALREKAA